MGAALLKVIEYAWLTCVGAYCVFAPGFVAYLWGKRRGYWDGKGGMAPVVSLVASAVLAYLTFWIHFLNVRVGKAFAVLALVATLVAAISFLRKSGPSVFKDVKAPFLFLMLASLFYTGLLRARAPHELTTGIASRVMDIQLPHDHVIPFLFASKLANREDPRDMGATWRSSDRPPLQAGFWLLARPLLRPLHYENEGYQAMGTLLALAWVPAIFALCAATGLAGASVHLPLFFCLLSSFFFENTVYVWPKFLAAAFCVFAYLLLIVRRNTPRDLVVASVCVALAMLSHGGSAFALIVFLPYWACLRAPRKLTTAIYFGVPAFLLYVPWTLYQKLYDPPGTRLLKVHLAGAIDVDPRSTSRAIFDAYSNTPFAEVVGNKLKNLASYFYGIDWSHLGISHEFRQAQFIALGHALAWLNLGLPIAAIFLLRRKKFPNAARTPLTLLAFCAAIYFVWSMLMFRPYNSVLYLGSYALPLLAFVSLASLVAIYSRRLALGLLAVHGAHFIWLWTGSYASVIGAAGSVWLAVSALTLLFLFRRYPIAE